MELLVFALIFILINIALLKYCNNIKVTPDWYTNLTLNGRKLLGNSELENIRKKVNSKKSKF
jgi:hypothetical protein